VRQLSDYRLEVERVVSEGSELAKVSSIVGVATDVQQLESKYRALLNIAKVSFQ